MMIQAAHVTPPDPSPRPKPGNRRVAEVMTPSPVVASPETPLDAVTPAFELHGYNAVPVVDERGALVGLVTKLSFLRLGLARATGAAAGSAAHDLLVRDVMEARVVAVEPDAPLDQVVERMLRSRLRSVPVVERRTRRVVGIVSRQDVLRGLGQPGAARAGLPRADDPGETAAPPGP